MQSDVTNHRDRIIGIWLVACAVVVFGMVVLGGVTRLTHSGLSITQWEPIVGVLPPLSEAEWLETFEEYKQFPEYQLVNYGMSLDEFEFIFWFEYAHRLLGRLIGIVFLLPLLVFIAKGYVQRPLIGKLFGLFVLGGAQGLMGWYMVQSGLVDEPRVSHLRLTAHLGLAVLIYGYMLWLAYPLLNPQMRTPASGRAVGLAHVVSVLVFVMILSGGLVAGTRAGFLFGTFPLMGESFFPDGLYATTPAWLAAMSDPVTIQFNHRILAYVLTAMIAWLAFVVSRTHLPRHVRVGVAVLVACLALQVTLGIATLVMRVPIALAAAHQGVALFVFGAALYASRALQRTARVVAPGIAA